MLIKQKADLTYSEITPKALYMGRRKLLMGMLISSGAVVGCKKFTDLFSTHNSKSQTMPIDGVTQSALSTSEKISQYTDVTTYNNFVEFGAGKDDPHKNARSLVTSPWTVSVEGEIAKPRIFTMDDLLKLAPLEERIYRLRCVEAWSIVVPWIGYSLSHLIRTVEPTSAARFIVFESYYDPQKMPLAQKVNIQLPYREALRLDEAMHPLTLLGVGMYGETLPNQNGAPVRLVIPWKYGFKSGKSLVRIRFVKEQPSTSWDSYRNLRGQQEYGFFANVNPEVPHLRWSQAKERRLGEFLRRPTLMFNGYADQVAHLYSGMNLRTQW